MLEDQSILNRLKYGDREALHYVYKEYKDILFTIAMSFLSDFHAAEDCLHDVFVKFASNICSLEIRSSLKGYLMGCIVNCARDQLRKNQNKLRCKIDFDCLSTSDASQEIIEREELARIFEFLAKLPDEQQEVIVLHLQGGVKFEEIAGIQHVSINTAQSRYRYGIEKLQKHLANGEKYETFK